MGTPCFWGCTLVEFGSGPPWFWLATENWPLSTMLRGFTSSNQWLILVSYFSCLGHDVLIKSSATTTAWNRRFWHSFNLIWQSRNPFSHSTFLRHSFFVITIIYVDSLVWPSLVWSPARHIYLPWQSLSLFSTDCSNILVKKASNGHGLNLIWQFCVPFSVRQSSTT